ncbi:MAG: hypothetical protein K2L93_01695 [Muribaculaceae bacterium]|nr:hypothetical protein [Muribaculaceae bacterium]MDE6320990.1 hypothetical protein [Muribaculaceae bacterium]
MIKSLIIAAITALLPLAAGAQASGNAYTQSDPADAAFMDMAVEMAQMAVEQGDAPGGTAIILNGAFHAVGHGATPELDALRNAHSASLANAAVYTVNEPTTEAWVEMSKRGVSQIYYANPREDVIEAGIYRVSDYDDSAIPADVTLTSKKELAHSGAAALIER